MKFDYIVGNPPYLNGLHLRIFNRSFEFLKDEGQMDFIHPIAGALILENKISIPKKRYQEIVSNHRTRFYPIHNPSKTFSINMYTAVIRTKLTKVPDKVDLSGINIYNIPQHIWKSVYQKYKNVIKKYNLRTAYEFYEPDTEKDGIPINRPMDEAIFISKLRDKYPRNAVCDKFLLPDSYKWYFKSDVARIGLLLNKSNINVPGYSRLVPIFDPNTTEEEMLEMLGLTDEELTYMRKGIDISTGKLPDLTILD